MTLELFANANRIHPKAGLLRSLTDATPLDTLGLVLGDKLTILLYLCDGEGGYDSESGDASCAPRVAVGLPGLEALAFCSTWSVITNGWTGVLELNTVAMQTFLAVLPIRDAYLEINFTKTAQTRTPVQVEVELLRELIATGTPSQTPVEQYPTNTQAGVSYVQNRSAVSGWTGGGSLNLDGLVTVAGAIAVNSVVAVQIVGVIYFYKLETQADAEAVPQVIIPDDDATLQWTLLSQTENVYVHTQASPASTWSGSHNLGRLPSSSQVWIGGRLAFGCLDTTTTAYTLTLSEAAAGVLYLTY